MVIVIFEKATAKINLSLDVLHKRDDGYHEVEMVLTTIDLSDRLKFEKANHNGIAMVSQSRYVPNDNRNLAYQAAELFKKRFNTETGVNIHIEKHIPIAAGLAGGSSDAAATLRGLNRLFDIHAPLNVLQEIGEEIGSDVPFCIQGGTALGKGRGEILKPLPSPPPCWVILAKPAIGVSTQSVYSQLNLDDIAHPNTSKVIESLEKQDLNQLIDHLGNVLEPVTITMHKEVARIKEIMTRAGAKGAMMSGSGPTVFALVKQESKAERIYNSLKGYCKDVYKVRILR